MFAAGMELLDTPPYSPVPARMTVWLRRLDSAGDRRAFFLRSYAHSTCSVMSAIEAGRLADPDWSLALLDLFEDYYFATLQSVHPFPSTCPPAWEVAHRLAAEPDTARGDALLLAVNAHINNDLPQALATLLDREWPAQSALLQRRRHDVWTITDVIAQMSGIDETWALPRIIRAWRGDAWDSAIALVTAASPRWQAAICEDIEHAALKRAHLIACVGGMREHLILLPTHDLHRAFDRHRGRRCRCGIATAACDSWIAAQA
jgi:Family of unknown function (DUF5995)